ncbi:putative phosphoribosyl transferase [Hartmannibacter diazotrophicus]|uniref:Putative phosphoribosyl transferase n=1 Tax=Hartmannibacter diazotrophicus TaxID=1482074 RepID=A0A2C9D7Q2_9HYPH|nr:phosphoribosyltransferase [Hartmannibacter diazotrophicus]SON56337.1 putative phosphoribosyl transferase [Hartmannibacter diazotrophicus]
MRFTDRTDAGQRLAKALAGYAGRQPVILALPRGGVPVAAQVAESLKAPLDLVLVRKIGVPHEPELAMGAVVDGDQPIVVRNASVISMSRIFEADFEATKDRELAEIERRRELYLGSRKRAVLAGRIVIVIDDGIATGATVKAALRAIRQRHPKELVLAVPVAPADTVAELRREVDELICLASPEFFSSIGGFYDDFRQVGDDEVIDTLARFPVSADEEASD